MNRYEMKKLFVVAINTLIMGSLVFQVTAQKRKLVAEQPRDKSRPKVDPLPAGTGAAGSPAAPVLLRSAAAPAAPAAAQAVELSFAQLETVLKELYKARKSKEEVLSILGRYSSEQCFCILSTGRRVYEDNNRHIKERRPFLCDVGSAAVANAVMDAVRPDKLPELLSGGVWTSTNERPIFCCIVAESPKNVVQAILRRIPIRERVTYVSRGDRYGNTSLFYCCTRIDDEILAVVVDAIPEGQQADVINRHNQAGETALIKICKSYRVYKNNRLKSCAMALLGRLGINIHATDTSGKRACEYAQEFFDECRMIVGSRRDHIVSALSGVAAVADIVRSYEGFWLPVSYEPGQKVSFAPDPEYLCNDEKGSFQEGDWVIVKRSSKDIPYTYGVVNKDQGVLGIEVEDTSWKSWERWSVSGIYRIPPTNLIV